MLWIAAIFLSAASADIEPPGPFESLAQTLPRSGVLHLTYASENAHGDLAVWIDFQSRAVLELKRSRVHLRDVQGRYSRGTGADTQTGELRGWDPDEVYFPRTILRLPHPVAQAVLLLAERENVSRIIESTNGWILIWDAPASKLVQWSEQGDVELDYLTQLRFEVSRDGRVLSCQQIELSPVAKNNSVFVHDYSEAAHVAGLSIPQYIDQRGEARRTPQAGVWHLQSAQIVDSVAHDFFTRDRAILLAAEAAKPHVQAFRDSFYWHDSPSASDQEAMPLANPSSRRRTDAWSSAFIFGGVVVLALGGFAWWRSRR